MHKHGLMAFLSCWILLLCHAATAQEGHPFNGTWRGEISSAAAGPTPVVIIMNYNGDTITGMINPGRNSYPFKSAVHDAPNWRITVNAENRQAETITFNGVMDDIGSRNRRIDGTWHQNDSDYTFHIARE